MKPTISLVLILSFIPIHAIQKDPEEVAFEKTFETESVSEDPQDTTAETLNDYLVKNKAVSQEVLVQEIQKRLTAEASIDEQDLQGNTPLLTAINLGLDKVAKFLIDRGARVKIRNFKRETALALAQNLAKTQPQWKVVVAMINARLARETGPNHRSRNAIESGIVLPGLEA